MPYLSKISLGLTSLDSKTMHGLQGRVCVCACMHARMCVHAHSVQNICKELSPKSGSGLKKIGGRNANPIHMGNVGRRSG